MRILIGLVVILAALAAGADFAARELAEQRVAARLEGSLDLGAQPEVEIGGFPFLLNFAAGIVPEVEVSIEDVSRRGGTLEAVTLRLENVRFDVAALSRAGGRVRVGGGSGSAEMTDEQLSALLNAEGVGATVRFAGREIFVSGEGLEGEVGGKVGLEGNALVVSAPQVGTSYAVALPEIGSGVSYRSVKVVDDRISLVLALRAGALEL